MKCPNCGFMNENEASFCNMCGTQLKPVTAAPPLNGETTVSVTPTDTSEVQNGYAMPYPPQNTDNSFTSEKKHSGAKIAATVVIFICLSLFLIGGALVAGLLFSENSNITDGDVTSSDSSKTDAVPEKAEKNAASVYELSDGHYSDTAHSYWLSTKDGDNYSVYCGDKLLGSIPLPGDAILTSAATKSATHALITCTDRAYLIADGGITQLPIKNAAYAVISDDASVIYTVTEEGVISKYDVKSGINRELDRGVNAETPTVSPDGQTVLYHKESFEGGYSLKLYMHSGASVKKLSDSMLALSVSNGARIIYATDLEGSLYTLNASGEAVRIGDFPENIQNIGVGRTSESLILASDKGVYLSEKGGQLKYMFESGGSVVLLAPWYSDGQFTYAAGNVFAGGSDSESDGTVYGYYYIDSKLSAYKLCTSEDFPQSLSFDSKSLIYVNALGALIRINLGDTVTKETLIRDSVIEAYPAPDGGIWYLSAEDKLHCIKNGADKTVASDVYSFDIDKYGNVFYETVAGDTRSGELWRVSDGEAVKLDCEVDGYFCESDHVYYIKNLDTETYYADIYVSRDGTDFKLCCQNEYSIYLT